MSIDDHRFDYLRIKDILSMILAEIPASDRLPSPLSPGMFDDLLSAPFCLYLDRAIPQVASTRESTRNSSVRLISEFQEGCDASAFRFRDSLVERGLIVPAGRSCLFLRQTNRLSKRPHDKAVVDSAVLNIAISR